MAVQFIKATIYLGLLFHFQTDVLGITCLSCTNVRHLKSCTDFITCPADETCSIQRQVDLTSSVNELVYTYTAGCRKIEECNLVRCAEELTTAAPIVKRDGVIVCSECCYNDTCNTKGCGASFREENDTDTTPYCFDCPYKHDNKSCNSFKRCDQNDVCLTSEGSRPIQNEPNTVFPYYILGCIRRLKCEILAQYEEGDKSKCCDTDFCNANPLASAEITSTAEIKECPTGLVKPTTAPPTTSTPTTTTSTTPTTPTTSTTVATTPSTQTTTTTTTPSTPPPTTTVATTPSTPPPTTTTTPTTPPPTTTTVATTPTTPATTTTTATTTTPTTTTTAATTTTQTTTPTTTTIAPTTPTTSTTTTPLTTLGFTTAPSTTPTTVATTPTPTTIPTTPTTTTMATTTQRPPRTIPPNPTRCYVCTDPVDFCEMLYVPQVCQPPNNYCINYISNKANGERTVNRTCGNFNTCYNDWYQGSSDVDRCLQFDGQVQTLNFECTYCCINDNCNQDLHPPKASLYSDL